MASNYLVRGALSDFLQTKPWTNFVTITFRKERRDAMYWLPRVWEILQDNQSTRAFLASERFQLGVGIHIHGLVYRPERRVFGGIIEKAEINRIANWGLWASCFHEFGRSKIEDVRHSGAVSSYCSKYIVKGGPDHYDFFGEWD